MWVENGLDTVDAEGQSATGEIELTLKTFFGFLQVGCASVAQPSTVYSK